MKFLEEWANFEFRLPDSWHGYDQGPLQLLLLKLLIPESTLEYEACEKYWKNATSYETYMAMVYCVRQALGVTKTWPGKVHIFRKFHAFVRDGWATNGYWCKADFMLHGWKETKLDETPFEKDIELSLCDKGLKAWKWRKEKKVSVERLRTELKGSEDFYRDYFANESRIHPFLDAFKINGCYPNCDSSTKFS
ncbi:unnamed protein product [Cylicocyclus nassatus]|uniref:Uncharacterized protein n=1 Tax=Cylicocyclus nassatus TaxID=53992 RepID=A0AA36H153_CYLNA|nr:unnamed protein product [Cylicocyclus nassatus]